MHLILPSLVQSKTRERHDSESASIITITTPTEYPTNDTDTETETDNDTSSCSSAPSNTVNTYRHHDFASDDNSTASSDWEPSISMASAYLPRSDKKSNKKLDLTPYNSSHIAHGTKSQIKLKQLADIDNLLFYPHNNLQSLIFSAPYCYIETDYKKIKNVNMNEDTDISLRDANIDMDWRDAESVNKIAELVRNLLVSASLSIGIREEELYLMFSSPSPQQIIEQLRFGILEMLCDVHLDRFGRRSYYRKNINYNINGKLDDAHFYKYSHLPNNLFASHDMSNLSHFLQESPTNNWTPVTPSNVSNFDSYPALPMSPIGRNNYNGDSLSLPIRMPHGNKFSEDMIDMAPVTYLLTKTKTVTFNNMNAKRTASDIGSKLKKKRRSKVSKAPNLVSVSEISKLKMKTNDVQHSKINKVKANKKGKTDAKKQSNKQKKKSNTDLSVSDLSKSKVKTNPDVQHSKDKKEKTVVKKQPNIVGNSTQPVKRHYINNKAVQKHKTSNTSHRDKKGKRENNMNKMSVEEFKSIHLLDIIHSNDLCDDNYVLSKQIAKYFDAKFEDTDTVCLVSEMHKQPAISYWIKGEYVRRDKNVFNNKYVLIYRSCRHIAAKKPIVSQEKFEKYVRDVCMQYEDESVSFICEKLDNKFGDGCHFVRSPLKNYNCFDVYCRFSDQYECSFKLNASKHYVISWRR